MKFLLILAMVLSFSLTIWADMPVYDEKKGEWVDGRVRSPSEIKKSEPQGTCMSGILLSIGIFLLGQRLIRKNEFNLQIKSPNFTLSD